MNMQTIKHTVKHIVKRVVAKKVASYKIVYRLEHKVYGVGPFRCGSLYSHKLMQDFFEQNCYDESWMEKHPTPESEGLTDDLIERCKCGCKDMKQLKSWFGDFIQPLIERENFQLVRYYVRVTGVHFTETQVLFEPEQVIKKVVVKKA